MLLTQAAGVIPAKAGIQIPCGFLDPGFRRGDVKSTTLAFQYTRLQYTRLQYRQAVFQRDDIG
jgi:hypothetical protein